MGLGPGAELRGFGLRTRNESRNCIWWGGQHRRIRETGLLFEWNFVEIDPTVDGSIWDPASVFYTDVVDAHVFVLLRE